VEPTEARRRRKRRRSRKTHTKVLSLTEGGIRTVLYLARLGQDRWVTGEEICRTQEINPSYLAKITGPLLKRGILSAVRGVGGGFRLGRPPDTISLLEVFETLQGPLLFNECLLGPGTCKRDGHCPVHPVWKQIQDGTERILALWTFSDLARRARALDTR
jgi:Rrf2 family transcriptional regulator, iron-sulfur cluster assembly transcription factor